MKQRSRTIEAAAGKAPKLLSRDDFREQVFGRDQHRCVFCTAPAADAHHLIERKLFPDGGYYLDNGVSVCGAHHFACERTDLSVEAARSAAGISAIIVPPGFAPAASYDKWGNELLGDGQIRPGPMAALENVRKVLAHKLHLFEGTDFGR